MELPVFRSLHEARRAGRLTSVARGSRAGSVRGRPGCAGRRGGDVRAARVRGVCVLRPGRRVSASSTATSASRRWPRPAATSRASPCATARHVRSRSRTSVPTAASQLFREDVALEIVESPPAFPPGDYDGLAVTPDDLPPLLRPDVLMDGEGYAAWERHMVAVCADRARAESALATLARDAGALRTWRGGEGPLRQAVARLAARPVRRHAARHAGRQPPAARRGHALRARRSASGARRAGGSPSVRGAGRTGVAALSRRRSSTTSRARRSRRGPRIRAAAWRRSSAGSRRRWRSCVSRPRGSAATRPRRSTPLSSRKRSARRTSS